MSREERFIGGWTVDDINAVMKKAASRVGGEEGLRRFQRDEIDIKQVEAIRLLFDQSRRRIPNVPFKLKAAVRDSNCNFRLERACLDRDVDFANRILRLHGKLGVDTGITAGQFREETNRLLSLIREDAQVANITNGVYCPVICPKLITDDIGAELEYCLVAVGESYHGEFPYRSFYNYRKGTLADNVFVVPGSHHNQLIERQKQGPVIGIHIPNPLQGFSVHADREQMAGLPERFILSGLDTAIAMIMYPDVLARGFYTPRLDLAAFSWRSPAYSLGFKAGDDGLCLGHTGDLARAGDGCSGGLFFFG